MMKPTLYGLWERQDGKWVRLYPALAYSRIRAINKFQDALLSSAMGYERGERRLRVVGHELPRRSVSRTIEALPATTSNSGNPHTGTTTP